MHHPRIPHFPNPLGDIHKPKGSPTQEHLNKAKHATTTDKREEYTRQAWEFLHKLGGDNAHWKPELINMDGVIHSERGNEEAAIDSFDQALIEFGKTPDNDLGRARVLRDYAWLYMKDSPETAREFLEMALESHEIDVSKNLYTPEGALKAKQEEAITLLYCDVATVCLDADSDKSAYSNLLTFCKNIKEDTSPREALNIITFLETRQFLNSDSVSVINSARVTVERFHGDHSNATRLVRTASRLAGTAMSTITWPFSTNEQ